jgi:hypothetical protein
MEQAGGRTKELEMSELLLWQAGLYEAWLQSYRSRVLNAGEIDGALLIDLNNTAIGYPQEQAMSTDALRAAKNTDKEIWRGKSRAECGDDDRYYADSLFIPESDVEALGINCGGHVIVKPIREWHRLALAAPASETCICCHGTDEAHGKVTHHCLFCGRERAAGETEKLPAKWRTMVPKSFYAIDVARDCANELEAALKADRQGR